MLWGNTDRYEPVSLRFAVALSTTAARRSPIVMAS